MEVENNLVTITIDNHHDDSEELNKFHKNKLIRVSAKYQECKEYLGRIVLKIKI